MRIPRVAHSISSPKSKLDCAKRKGTSAARPQPYRRHPRHMPANVAAPPAPARAADSWHAQQPHSTKTGISHPARCSRHPAMQRAAPGVDEQSQESLPVVAQSRGYTDTHASLSDLCAAVNGRVTAFLGRAEHEEHTKRLQEQVRTALSVVEEALVKYSFEHVAFAYNGGKDCLVLLILYLASLHTHFSKVAQSGSDGAFSWPASLRSIHILPPDPFPEVDAFVKSSADHYFLDITSSSLPMVEAFAEYLDMQPDVRMVFVGMRRTDPRGGNLAHFTMTDRGWPSFMRCHPVIDWKYQDIWNFLRHFEVPYCSLYDRGFTSLGGISNTRPNPALEVDNGGGSGGGQSFRPAYELMEDKEERLGRGKLG